MKRLLALAVAIGWIASSPVNTAAGQKKWTVPRTVNGQPDLQGIWDFRSATPLERPKQFADREFMSADEVIAYEQRALEREDGRPPDDPRTEQSVHPAWWLDYGKTVVKTRRTSLIVDPPDGKIPPMTDEGQKRAAARRAEARTHGPADSYENRGLFERCLTRGVPEGLLPGPYNNNLQILQTPGYVVLLTEMIHDARIVPIDGRPRDGANVRRWLGDARGRWEGDTLVVDTIDFTDKTNFRGSGARLHLVERFTRLDADTLEYRFTVDDPTTWTRPWTVAYPMMKTDGPIYEYACHEANYGLADILSGARAEERKATEDAAKRKP
ncbi:MAG TPA: hypothetical protein VGQ16_04660 [Vicinamibacterales bacterium]|jgi:hypothetical protein|nr:hypothetical protein [Vicinamibacterales bacterium]